MPYKDKLRERQRQRVRQAERRVWLNTIKAQPCTDCNKGYPPEVMEFDHIRGTKRFNIGLGWKNRKTLVLKEIAKCDLVCANCHRLRHIARVGENLNPPVCKTGTLWENTTGENPVPSTI